MHYAELERACARAAAAAMTEIATYRDDAVYRIEHPETEINAALAQLTRVIEGCIERASK